MSSIIYYECKDSYSGGWLSCHNIDEEKLSPLSLYCTGGGFKDKENRTWWVHSFKYNFIMVLDENQYKNVKYYYNVHLRKNKLKKLNEINAKYK